MTGEMPIDPVRDLGGLLLEVEKPARYVGGEEGILSNNREKIESALRTLIAFPDLYEIGMGNQALRIIYNRLNNKKDILCDRAFAPAPDFEKLLREKNIPLYGLDTGLSLASFDMLMFTIGYELGLNGVLLMLDVSQIPLRINERDEAHPIVIAGGPAVSNPVPYSPFIDAFWIGEAEAGFFDLADELADLKKRGQGRAALLEKISSHPHIWVRGKEKALRAIFTGFSSDDTQAAVFPVPSMKIVHNHGTVEIMRGCPNGCRFCHAGFWYRPMRQKNREQITAQVRDMVTKGGWHEISLSSLSSGDYCGADDLLEYLNEQFSPLHISFQMPSLKVSGFSLDLLEKISATRKSGLTFAVETPQDAQQMSINKEVTRDSVAAILEEAKKRGWKGAKFYFMIGLPLPAAEKSEEEEIVDFIADVARRTRMHFNINIGIFIPKPHTPYQFAPQISSAEAGEKLVFLRSRLKPMGHKVSVADTMISQIEGLLSRGDERAGFLCEEAYRGGSRLDAWNEYINKDKWQSLLEKAAVFSRKGNPPWEVIDSCVSKEFLKGELEKSENCKRTVSCIEKCSLCGVCGKNISLNKASNEKTVTTNAKPFDVNPVNIQVNKRPNNNNKSDPGVYKAVFSFSKKGSAVFHGHLSLIEIFSMAFKRADVPVLYTQGYNPLVKIDFASSLSTGISADCEIASVYFAEKIQLDNNFIEGINAKFPQGIKINNAGVFYIHGGKKKHSLASLLWGFAYTGAENGIDYVNSAQEKSYRQNRLKDFPGKKAALFSLKRNEVLARNITGDNDCEWISYFDAYRFLYPCDIV